MIFRWPKLGLDNRIAVLILDYSPASQSRHRTETLLGIALPQKVTLELLGASLCGRVHATHGNLGHHEGSWVAFVLPGIDQGSSMIHGLKTNCFVMTWIRSDSNIALPRWERGLGC